MSDRVHLPTSEESQWKVFFWDDYICIRKWQHPKLQFISIFLIIFWVLILLC